MRGGAQARSLVGELREAAKKAVLREDLDHAEEVPGPRGARRFRRFGFWFLRLNPGADRACGGGAGGG